MAALSFLRKFQFALDSNYEAIPTVMTASSDRLYIGGQQGSSGLNGKVFAFDFQGVRMTGEEFTVAAAFSFGGLFFLDDVLYQVQNRSTSPYISVVPYSLSGVAGNAIAAEDAGDRTDGPIANSTTQGFAIIGNKAYVPYMWRRSSEVRYQLAEYDWPSMELTNDSAFVFPDAYRSMSPEGFTDRVGGWYLGYFGSPSRIVGFDTTLTEDSVNSFNLESGISLNGIAYNGFTLFVQDLFGPDIRLYGVETPVAVLRKFTPTRQYEGMAEFEERFDIVTPGQGTGISEVKATNIKGIRQTGTSLVGLPADADLATRLNTLSFVPKDTVPNIAVGDVLFLNTSGNEEPVLLATERWAINGKNEVGNGKSQTIISTKVSA